MAVVGGMEAVRLPAVFLAWLRDGLYCTLRPRPGSGAWGGGLGSWGAAQCAWSVTFRGALGCGAWGGCSSRFLAQARVPHAASFYVSTSRDCLLWQGARFGGLGGRGMLAWWMRRSLLRSSCRLGRRDEAVGLLQPVKSAAGTLRALVGRVIMAVVMRMVLRSFMMHE